MRITLTAALPLIAALVLAPNPALAQSSTGFRARVWGGTVGRYVLSDNDPFAAPGFGTAELQVTGSAPGFGGDVEYKFARWIGLDAAIGYSSLNVQFTTSNEPGIAPVQRFAVVPALLSLNIHIISTSAVDLWVGPQVGYVMFPNTLSYTTTHSGTFTYTPSAVASPKGFSAGVDIGLSKKVLLNLAVRWQDADADADSHLTIDPTFVTIGIGIRP